MIKAYLLAYSTNSRNENIATFHLQYPRYIHAQLMTHRVFSRNSASSRAIPTETVISNIVDNPVKPIVYGKNQRGMQSNTALEESEAAKAEQEWNDAMWNAIHSARKLSELKLHKQYANRILEPFMHIEVILTGTDFSNFFALRIDDGAQPEIQELATQMQNCLDNNQPIMLSTGQWHVPMILPNEVQLPTSHQLIVSAARCARISYRSLSTNMTSGLRDDLILYNKLASSGHWSPFEHQAMSSGIPGKYRNFMGWIQQRAMLEDDPVFYEAQCQVSEKNLI